MSNTPPLFILNSPDYKTISTLSHPQDFEVIKSVLRYYEKDLQPVHGYFSKQDFDKISEITIQMFFKKLISLDVKNISSEEIHYAWREVHTHFLKNYWGYIKHQQKPSDWREAYVYNFEKQDPALLPAKQKEKSSYKDAFFYIWAVLQSFIITKALILVYGNDLAKDDSFENRVIFGVVIFFSFGSLFFFAWLRRNKKYR